MKRSILPGMILGLLLGLPLSVAASTVVPQGKENAALIPEDQLLYSLPKTETGDYILRCVDRHGPKSVLRTAYFLTPPYAIHALCRTTATNVRFTLLDGELIFNWEGNPAICVSTCRFARPGTVSPTATSAVISGRISRSRYSATRSASSWTAGCVMWQRGILMESGARSASTPERGAPYMSANFR
ncbi:MAG: hypothetical protein L6W00_18780 [Lentisphaeria bacterium]|nr:MAG: hypothetical protein L6W00_18780 [Lentisphaeria bacterium]